MEIITSQKKQKQKERLRFGVTEMCIRDRSLTAKGEVGMSDKTEKIEKLVEKKHWAKLQKYLNGNEETKIALAKACSKADADETINMLVTLLHDPSETVQLEAVHSLRIVGNDHATTQLQWLLNQLSADKTELISAIHEAIANVRHKQ